MTVVEKAELLRLIGHPTRLAIIQRLAKGPQCVSDIRELLDVPQANVSQHLMALRSQRIVDFYEDGKLRCYYIARPNLAALVLQFLGDEYGVVRKSKDEVRRAAKARARDTFSLPSSKDSRRGGMLTQDLTHIDLGTHWEKVYQTKDESEVSWHQEEPTVSLELIREVAAPESDVIDVGGGSSVLAGRLVALGFQHVTVLDISPSALERAKARIGEASQRIHWIAADIRTANDFGQFVLWHDRAVFHFLTDSQDRKKYVSLAERSIPEGGHLVIGTFALHGPENCSGLPVERYDAGKLAGIFSPQFTLAKSVAETHTTPWGSEQRFIYGVLRRSGPADVTTLCERSRDIQPERKNDSCPYILTGGPTVPGVVSAHKQGRHHIPQSPHTSQGSRR